MRISRGRKKNEKRFAELDRWTRRRKADAADSDDVRPRISAGPEKAPDNPGHPVSKKTSSKPKAENTSPPDQPGGSAPAKPRKKRRLLGYAVIAIILIMALLSGAAFQQLRIYLRELPAEKSLERFRPMLISSLYSSGHELIGEYAHERRKLISYEEIPEQLVQAVVAREDKNFFSHFGLDPYGIARAIYVDIKARRFKEGGSTLTQQLVKNLTSRREKVIKRKIKEALLALKVERTYSKQEILEMYLNQVYFGHGCYGVGSAAELYFGKEVKDLDLNECAMLAGLIRLPESYSPFRNPERARLRRVSVLRRMFEDGYITAAEMNKASKESLRLARKRRRMRQRNLAPHFYEYVRLSLDERTAAADSPGGVLPPYPLETAAVRSVGLSRLYSDGLSIETTLDYDMQQAAESALRQGLHRVEQIRRQHPSYWGEPESRVRINTTLEDGGVYEARITRRINEALVEVELPEVPEAAGTYRVVVDPENSWLNEFGVLDEGYWMRVRARRSPEEGWVMEQADEAHVQGCLIALEAETGKILAMVGGYNFFEDQPGAKIIFPVQAALQPGSCFKPILYSCALSRGLTPSDRLTELPLEYTFREKTWRIQNFESTPWNPALHGQTPLRRALVKSMNVASVHLWNLLTRDNHLATVSRYARENIGLRSRVRNERASALGVSEVYPMELAAAYAIFANGGRRIRPYAIERISDHFDNVIARQYPRSEPFLTDPKHASQVAYQITHMLNGVVREPEGTAYRTLMNLYPEGFPYPVAGKTGTTNDCTDAWFTGYSPDIVCCVWVGFHRKKSLGNKMTGSKAALPVWAEFMDKAIPIYFEKNPPDNPEITPKTDFPVASGIHFVEVCKKSGLLANDHCKSRNRTYREAFIIGTEPQEYCTYHGPADMEAMDAFFEEVLTMETSSRSFQ